VGRGIIKYFDDAPYSGVVNAFHAEPSPHKPDLYTVNYDDGDVEDYSIEDLRPLMKAHERLRFWADSSPEAGGSEQEQQRERKSKKSKKSKRKKHRKHSKSDRKRSKRARPESPDDDGDDGAGSGAAAAGGAVAALQAPKPPSGRIPARLSQHMPPLPQGWVRVYSRSRMGSVVHLNRFTGGRCRQPPRSDAQGSRGDAGEETASDEEST
jgi:hypothetical protein